MKKKITAIIVCAAVALSLTACGSDGESSTPNNGADKSTSTSSTESSKTESSSTVSVNSTESTFDSKPEESSTESTAPEWHVADEADFEIETVEGGVSITKYIGSDTNVVIPETIGGERVVMLGNEAFYHNTNLLSVTIPDSVVSVGECDLTDTRTFFGCNNLTEVIFLGDDLPFFSTHSFQDTPWWDAKETENSDYTIVNNVLIEWKKKGGVAVIPDGVTKINAFSFNIVNKVTGIVIPDSVTEIGEGAFSGMEKITEITIPDSVTEIGKGTFAGCMELKKVTLSKNITKIPERAFYYCINLETVDIPDGVTSIEMEAFAASTGGSGINIPDSVMEIHGDWGINNFTYKGKTYESMGSNWGEFYEDFDGIVT